jgi:uncharacterized membrane protein YczE
MGGRAARDISLDVVTVPTWRELRRRLPQLLVGIPVLGLGIALTLQARLGVSPYDVLHQGIAKQTGLSFGTVVIGVGLVILVLWIPLRQRPGIGTVVNTLTVGLVIDLASLVLPEPDLLVARVPLLLGGTAVTALGMGLYIGAGLGPGPRDGLMTGVAAKGSRCGRYAPRSRSPRSSPGGSWVGTSGWARSSSRSASGRWATSSSPGST